MAKTLTMQTILAQIRGDYANTSDGVTANTNFSQSYSDSLTSGTATAQADLFWDDARQVGVGANDDIDFAAGTCTDIYGALLTFVEIRGIMIKNLETVAGEDLDIGGGGATEWLAWVGAAGDHIVLHPDGLFLYTAPVDGSLPIVAGVTDILRITGQGASPIDYHIWVWGTSA
jgi:hypothetical protein